MENDPNIEIIENAYREEEYGKRIAPPAAEWKGIQQRKKFKTSWFFRFSLLAMICLLVPLTYSHFGESKPAQYLLSQPKSENGLSDISQEHDYSQVTHNDPKTASSQLAEIKAEDTRQRFHEEDTDLTDPDFDDGLDDGLKEKEKIKNATHPASAPAPAKYANTMPQQNSALAEVAFSAKTTEEPSYPELMFQLCPGIDRDIRPLFEDTLSPTVPFHLNKRWEASVGFLFDKRKYAPLQPSQLEGYDKLQFREKGFYINLNAPISESISLEAGVELLKSDNFTGSEYIEDIETFMQYDSAGTMIDPISGDTITVYDSTLVTIDDSRYANFDIRVETTNIPINMGYTIRKGRLSITPSLGICYQMSKFHISGTNRDDLPEPFGEESPLRYQALFITGNLRVKYLLKEHFTLEVGGSCRGLLFEKSDYFTAVPSPGYGIFRVGISYVF